MAVQSVKQRNAAALDGTPALDIKPWSTEMGPRCETHQPPWVSEMLE